MEEQPVWPRPTTGIFWGERRYALAVFFPAEGQMMT